MSMSDNINVVYLQQKRKRKFKSSALTLLGQKGKQNNQITHWPQKKKTSQKGRSENPLSPGLT